MARLNAAIISFFVIFCLALGYLAAALNLQQISINSNLLELLPKSEKGPAISQAQKLLGESFSQQIILLSLNKKPDKNTPLSKALPEYFCQANAFFYCQSLEGGDDTQALLKLLKQHRYQLLGKNDKALLNNNPELILDNAYQRLFAFQSSLSLDLNSDPLGLSANYQQQLLKKMADTDIERGMLQLQKGKQRATAIILQTKNALSMEQQAQAVAWLNSQKQRFTNEQTNHKLIHSGALFHSQQAAQNAKKEIAIISSISIIAIVLLFWLAFKSITPLLLGIGSLAFAFIASCIVSFSVFQSVHVITLVFGASLIGVSIDYCLHMLCENQYHPDQKNSLQKIFPALVVGLISSCIGYGILAQSSLVSLQQIAVFSVTGLFSAWLFVVVFISRFRAKAVNNSYLLNAASIAERFWQQLGQRQSLFVLIALFVSSTIIVAFTANPLNSIRSLYQAEDAILQQDKIVSGWLKNISANQFFIISANNNDALLEQELNLTNKLDALIEEQKLSNYKALSQFLASSSEQKNNYQLLQQQVYSDQGLAARFYQKINASSAMLEQSRADFQQSEHLLLTVEALQAVLPKALQNLYLGEINGKVYSLVLLQGIKELTPLEQLTNNDIRFIDNVALISSSLQNQQQHALQQLLLAYALIALLLLLRFRQISSIALLGPAFLSSLLSIAVICLLGLPITLFHIFALFLCLGLGLDYAIFLFEGKLRPSTMIAVFLSALTSLLSFGLLSLSSTAMISAFGLCILLGSLANFLLAPGFILLIKGHQE